MRVKIISVLLFLLCFAGAVLAFDYVLVSDAGDNTSEMDSATFPLVYAVVNDMKINCMHGYVGDVDASLIRDTITPIEESEKVKLIVDGASTKIKKMHYELRSADASSLVEDGDILSFKKDKHGDYTTTLKIRMQLKENQDYVLKLTLLGDEDSEITYYTRLFYGTNLHLGKQLNFAYDYHNSMFDKDQAERMQKYMEYDYNKTTNNLGNIDITSSFEGMTYADLDPSQIAEPMVTVTDLSEDIACVQMKYVLSANINEDTVEYYFATENYKIRYTTSRMYLLSYNRNMDSIYNQEFINKTNNSLKMGITDVGVNYLASENCKKVAFAKNGELFYYNYQNSQITKVFSFLREGFMDPRDNYDRHDIRLIRIDDNGNIAFAVYGYMNRGRHEGENGVLFYRYKAEDNQIEEIAFVPSMQPFSALQEDVNQVAYMSENNDIYLCMDGVVYAVDSENQSYEMMLTGVTPDTVVSSATNKYVAELISADSNSITVHNLETKETKTISDGNEMIRILGFVGDDLVYGKVRSEDIVVTAANTTYYPIYQVVIVDSDGNKVKEYTPSSGLVMSAQINDNLVELNIAKKRGNHFTDKEQEYIIGKEAQEDHDIMLDYIYSNHRYKEMYMVFPSSVYINDIPELLYTKETRLEDSRTVEIESEESSVLRYFVYVNGNIADSVMDVATAISMADEHSGDVVNSKQKTVWEACGILDYATVGDDVPLIKCQKEKQSLEACVAMILSFEDKPKDLAELISQKKPADELISDNLENKEGVNLTGCTLNEMMYYICKGHPVIAKNDDGNYVLVTSFNESLVKYMNPVTGETERKKFSEMAEKFEAAGNEFYTYLK